MGHRRGVEYLFVFVPGFAIGNELRPGTHVADQCTRLEQAKEKEIKDQSKDAKDLSRKQKKIIAIKTRLAQSAVSRTIWWKLTFWVSLIGAVKAAIMYRLDQRRNLHLPLPRVEMRW